MGLGDCLMAAGRAKIRYQNTGRPIAIGNGHTILWSPVYQNNPFLTMPGYAQPDTEWIIDHPGNRPYIDYPATARKNNQEPYQYRGRHQQRHGTHWVWNQNHRAEPAEIYWSEEEERLRERLANRNPYVIVEPHTKTRAAPAKRWPFERYQAVINELRNHAEFVQCDVGQEMLRGIHRVQGSFRDALAWTSKARAYLGPEGGLHHGAAATGTRAVVLFGGYIPPTITGYRHHTNLFVDHPPSLGRRTHTTGPDPAMLAITTDTVANALAALL